MSEHACRFWRAPVATWWLGAAAAEMPEAAALRIDDTRCSFAELAASSEDRAAALVGLGVSRGDRVALIAAASRRVVEVIHAAQRIGAVVAPISPRLTARETDVLITAIRPRAVLADEGVVETLAVRPHDAVIAVLPALDRLVRKRLAPPLPLDSTAVHSLVCTSGTTGVPTAIALTHANHHTSAVAAAARLDYRTGQRWLAVLPLHHVGGLAVLLRAAIVGAEVVLLRDFDARLVSQALSSGDLAHASLVPTMLHRLLPCLEAPGLLTGARSCRFLVGGAALTPELAAGAHALGLDVRATYGMTETASQVATSERGELVEHPGTSGRALDGIELRVGATDRDGFGELFVRGPQVAAAAFDAAATRRELLREGWLHTGDVARIDRCGRLFVGSRRVDLIVSGGENVRPEEVERVLEAHPAVAEAGVYGTPDIEWGERVAALVVPRDCARIDVDELAAWCRARLAAHKLPRIIEIAAALPRTSSGKLQRRKLASSR